MRFRGVLVRPLAEQGDRDGTFIDPAGVRFEPGHDYPVFPEFDYSTPLGWAQLRAEDGMILAEGEVEGDLEAVMGDSPPRLAAGVAFNAEDALPGVRGRVVADCRLNSVSLTGNHADPGQPAIEVLPARVVKRPKKR